MKDSSMKEEEGEPAWKRGLAWILFVLMVAAFAHSAFWLYQESSAVCEHLSREFEMMSGSMAPCGASYFSGPEKVLRRRSRVFYGPGGELERLETYYVESGEDVLVDCSFSGRLALLFREPELWLNHGISREVTTNIDNLAFSGGSVDHETRAGVPQAGGEAFERVTLSRANAEGGLEWKDSRLLDEKGRLLERVFSASPPGSHQITWRHEFDEERNVRIRRVETLLFEEKMVSEVHYHYACAE